MGFTNIDWIKNFEIILGIILIWGIIVYNIILKAKIKTNQAWANIDVQLKRRYDLIPNLVEVVKAYKNYEANLLKEIVDKRNEILAKRESITKTELAKNEKGLSEILNNFFALSEAYPELKANKNFLELQRQLEDTEDKIESARSGYNWRVADYNYLIGSFPNSIIAKLFNFKDAEMFKIKNEIERENIKVNLK